jgi:hypothetical protein
MTLIRFQFQLADPSSIQARQLVEQLRQKALDLPFREVGEIVDVAGDDTDFNQLELGTPLRLLLMQSVQHVEQAGTQYWLTPNRVIGFHVFPGDGPEQINLGLAAYPRVPSVDLGHWYWSSVCSSHNTIEKLLDSAAELGILKDRREEVGLPDDWFDEIVG